MIYVLEYIKKRCKEKKLKVTLNEMWFLGPEYEFDVRDWGFMCPAGVNTLAILSNGEINGCPLVEDMIEGHIRKDNLAELWENKFQKYRDTSWKKVGLCQDCQWFEFCCGEGLHFWKKPYKGLESCPYQKMKEALCEGS